MLGMFPQGLVKGRKKKIKSIAQMGFFKSKALGGSENGSRREGELRRKNGTRY